MNAASSAVDDAAVFCTMLSSMQDSTDMQEPQAIRTMTLKRSRMHQVRRCAYVILCLTIVILADVRAGVGSQGVNSGAGRAHLGNPS